MDAMKKLMMVKDILGNTLQDDNVIMAYIEMAGQEILSWKYSYARSMPSSVDAEDEITQVMAVVAGYNQRGAENQKTHNENGIDRSFHFTDMVAYIRAHVIPYAKLG